MGYAFPMMVPVARERAAALFLDAVDVIRTRVLCWFWGVAYGRKSVFHGPAMIRTRNRNAILIGSNVRFNSRGNSNPVGLWGQSILDTRFGGRIVIGENSGFSAVTISSRTSVIIGKNVLVGGNVKILDHDFHPVEPEKRRSPQDVSAIRSRPIVIEDDVFIGANAIILKGTHIGARSIVAAGSVVFGLDIPPDSMVKGNPAIIVPKKKG